MQDEAVNFRRTISRVQISYKLAAPGFFHVKNRLSVLHVFAKKMWQNPWLTWSRDGTDRTPDSRGKEMQLKAKMMWDSTVRKLKQCFNVSYLQIKTSRRDALCILDMLDFFAFTDIKMFSVVSEPRQDKQYYLFYFFSLKNSAMENMLRISLCLEILIYL